MDGQLPATPMPDVPRTVPTPASTPSSRLSLLAVLILGLLISAGGALLYWQTSRLKPPAETAAPVTLESPSAVVPTSLPAAVPAKELTYVLPTGWSEQPAEGELTPYYTFLKRLRSPDNCNLVVLARFRTDNLSLNEFLSTQYPGSTLIALRHSAQPSFAGLDSFTVRPQADGESFSTFIRANGYVYGLFASYALETERGCLAEPPELAQLLSSVKLQ